MGPTVIAVISAVSTVASTVQGISSAKKQKKIEQRKVALQQEKTSLEATRERARLARDRRKRQASIVNRSRALGLSSSSLASAGITGVASQEQREGQFLSSQVSLANQSADIRGQEIRQQTSDAIQGQVLSGIGDVVGAGSSSGLFSGGSS